MSLDISKQKPKVALYCDDRFIKISNEKYKPMNLEEFQKNFGAKSKHLTKKVLEDIKACVNFDLENCSSSSLYGKSIDGKNMVNYQNIGDFCFLGYTAGGDWEHPLFFIVYYDGAELRGYVPTSGNVFYLPEKAAFGSTDAEADDISNFIIKEFPQYTKEEIMYAVNNKFYFYDFNWIIKDIVAHFQIKIDQ